MKRYKGGLILRGKSMREKRRRRRILFRSAIVVIAGLGLLAAVIGLIWSTIWMFSQRNGEQALDWEYASTASHYADEYDVPLEVVYAVIETESHFDADAQSGVGACGLMQLMPDTYDWIQGRLGETDVQSGKAEGNAQSAVAPETPGEQEAGIFDPVTNIRYGVYYLSYLYERFGVWETVYAGYNAGPNIVAKWLEDAQYSSDGVTLEQIPYTETANYVVKVSEARERYHQLLTETE